MSRALLSVWFWWASQYSPGVMEDVVWTRQNKPVERSLSTVLPHTDGYIAVRNCEFVGDVWWLKQLGGPWESFLVVDCAHPSDGTRAWMDGKHVLAEVDYQTAVRWGVVDRMAPVLVKGAGPTVPELTR